jgi:hypothetical protein
MKQESIIQTQIVSALSMLAINHNFLFFSVPNEGFLLAVAENKMTQRNHAKLTILKKMGMTPGASDLVIMHRGRAFCMEVKAPDGEQSTNQYLFEEWCGRCSVPYRVVRSVDEAMQALREWEVIR